jgi:hypothetical protein
VIDESKGGDAIVAWKDKVANLDALKRMQGVKVAFTPNSPSEHLLRSMAVHFDVPALRGKGPWRVEADGSSEALKKLLARQSDVAVVWEPDVTRALANNSIVKLLGTEDTRRLIVDILLVGRGYSTQHPDAVNVLLTRTFWWQRSIVKIRCGWKRGRAETKLPPESVKRLLEGCAWASLSDNAQTWLGATTGTDALVDTIQSTARILVDAGDFKSHPLPDQDPYRIISRQFISKLYVGAVTGGGTQSGPPSLERKFAALSDAGWQALKEVGTLKALPVGFQSGTAELSHEGKLELDRAMDTLSHYPNFRVVIKGHTGCAATRKKTSFCRRSAPNPWHAIWA